MRCYVRRGSTSFNSAMFCYLRWARGLNNITACWKSQPWVSTPPWYSLFKRFHVQRLAYRVTVIKFSVALLLQKYQGSRVALVNLNVCRNFFFMLWRVQCMAIRLHNWCIGFPNSPAVVQAILSSVKLCLSLTLWPWNLNCSTSLM